jgi:hypothetical protein
MLLNSFLSWIMKKRIHQIELFMKYPHDVQQDVFKRLLAAGGDTVYGRKYGFNSIGTYEEFSGRLPVMEYQHLSPWIERVRKGEQNVLWNTEIKWFAKSSGTTADKSKFIPVSSESLEECHFKGGKDMLSIYCNNYPETEIFNGKSLAMGGSHYLGQLDTESYYGDLSAIIIQNLPFWAEFYRTPNLNIALMDEWEQKIEKMAEATIQEDVTNITGVPSWVLVLLQRILHMTGKQDIHEVWPNLELFIHGGVSFLPYREKFNQLVGQPVNLMETYNASEGFFGIQDLPNRRDMLLMLDYGVFYEFIPTEELGNDHPKALALNQVELLRNYALLISTNAGLWRYLIGDTIEFTSLDPYRIRITGRTRSFINAVGEELIIDNAEKAMLTACQKTHAVLSEYTAGPDFLSEQRVVHKWYIEFEIEPENIGLFTEILDNALKASNSDYEAKRYHNLLLQTPDIRVVPPGTFYHWLKSKNKLGGQHKVPRLSNNLNIITEIEKIICEVL